MTSELKFLLVEEQSPTHRIGTQAWRSLPTAHLTRTNNVNYLEIFSGTDRAIRRWFAPTAKDSDSNTLRMEIQITAFPSCWRSIFREALIKATPGLDFSVLPLHSSQSPNTEYFHLTLTVTQPPQPLTFSALLLAGMRSDTRGEKGAFELLPLLLCTWKLN